MKGGDWGGTKKNKWEFDGNYIFFNIDYQFCFVLTIELTLASCLGLSKKPSGITSAMTFSWGTTSEAGLIPLSKKSVKNGTD